ncbi:Indole-3-glycerol phosphate synthase [Candidatus Bilamarchaeum dharawalense]|uniref:indole-3-glycerol-phosphate synthase n=1 Tax=Candidatus Bilamarchaeum dharawalense TaxID=2885759 RepID=A0A5E4LRZ0_9ARCH|nr:Indole-3-glycerol phosphate synthase [Candidatus Bilamarchaeum dharawalense]
MNLLDKFIEHAEENIENGYYNIRSKAVGPKSSLVQRIRSQGFVVISEIKHASPSGEYSFDEMDVESSAMTFMKSGADAISVVVEPKIFKGNILDVPLAKKTGLPVLFKDFIIERKQIEAARNVGADAILLIVKVAKKLELDLDELIAIAHENELEVVLESYDEDEMKIALGTKADVLGINNRDLDTLKIDIERTKRILEHVGRINRPVISESGIRNAADVAFVRSAGASGVLVGTAIWRSEDIGEKIKELRGGAK